MFSLHPTTPHKVAVIGSGNWGTAIARIVAQNTPSFPTLFHPTVQMWVYEETIPPLTEGSPYHDPSSPFSQHPQKLTTLINNLHENIKYLPDITLPHNLIANPDIEDTAKDATILIFNLPHQFLPRICDNLKGKILPYARGISCIKGVDVERDAIHLFSDSIGQRLKIYCGALSGANIANEVAAEKYSETTIAYDPPQIDSKHPTPVASRSASPTSGTSETAPSGSKSSLTSLPSQYPGLNHATIKSLFHRPVYFHVRLVHDVAGVSLGGALKNIVALAAGFVSGMGWGDNAKAAVMRVGVLEQVKFGSRFFGSEAVAGDRGFKPATMTEESCGVADLITSCSGGRNFRCARMSVERKVSVEVIEEKELNGQKLQGVSTAKDVHAFLDAKGMVKDFPLFTAVYDILEGRMETKDIPGVIEER